VSTTTRPARFIGGGDIVVRRGRATIVSEEVIKKHIVELKQGVADGRIIVTTLGGQPVDLATMTAAPVPTTPPKPNVRLDSAANDKTFLHGVGNAIPQYQDGLGMTQTAESPAVSAAFDMDGDEPVAGTTDPVGERKRRRYKKSESNEE
jgi:hypothetical protein